MLSKRLKALTTATTHTAVASRSTADPTPSDQPRSAAQSTAARPISTTTRCRGGTRRRSSSVPTAHSTRTPPSTGSVWSGWEVNARTATTKAETTAAPPRYGVGVRCPL
jgi:hypothetical protein